MLCQEITRLLSGDILSEWQYNKAGKPTDHNVKAITRNTDTRTRKYTWGINNQLKSMTNNLSGGGTVTYGYDEFSNLVSAKHDGFSERIADI